MDFSVSFVQTNNYAMLIAILLPWLSLLIQGRIFAGLVCLGLQMTVIGWIPAAIWSVTSLQNKRAEKRNDKLIAALKANRGV